MCTLPNYDAAQLHYVPDTCFSIKVLSIMDTFILLMRTKIIILALVICLALLPVFQVQGQIDSKPEILDATQVIPITGENCTIITWVSDPDGVDIVRIYVYFRIFDTISTPEYPTVTETSTGVYQSTIEVPINASIIYYTISASDDNGVWNITDVLNRDVQDNMAPVAVSIASANVDLGVPYQFNGSSSLDNVGIVNYDWSFVHDGTTITLNGTEPVFNFTKYGTYIITLKVTDAGGNWDTASISVSTNDVINPVADLWIEPVRYVGQLIEFDGSNSTDNVAIAEYTWSFYHNGTLISLNGQNPEFRFWEAREYNITLTVIDAAGNSDQESFTIYVLHDTTVPSEEIPWWSIALMVMVIAVMITTVFILKSSKD